MGWGLDPICKESKLISMLTLVDNRLSVINKLTSLPANEFIPPPPTSPVSTEIASPGTEFIISPISKNKFTKLRITESSILDAKSKLAPVSRLVSDDSALPSSNEPNTAIDVGKSLSLRLSLL